MTSLEEFLEKVRDKKIVDIVRWNIDYHDRMDKGGLSIHCGDYDDDGRETLILLDDGSCICVWASEWGGMKWFPTKENNYGLS